MRLIAVRHAETEWNLAGREMGQLDSPLTERGLAQSEALARRLATIPVDELYTSDLGRAIETAACITRTCGKFAHIDRGLRERHMGVLQGLTPAEMNARYTKIRAEYERVGFYNQIPDGESAVERRDRSVQVLSAIAARHPNRTVIAVTHGGLLAAFLEFVLELPFGGSRGFAKSHASLNRFECSASGWRLDIWNGETHLEGRATMVR